MLGDGDGRFLAQFLAHQPSVHVLAIDTSAIMLRLLRRRCLQHAPAASEHLRTRQTSAVNLCPAPGTDLVISHFFLDCLSPSDLGALVTRFARDLRPGARWLISDFDLPASPLLRPLARLYLRALYAAFQLLTGLRVSHLPPIAPTLQNAGFRSLRRCEFAAGLLYTELWQLGSSPDPGIGSTPPPAQPLQPLSHPLRGLVSN